MSWIISHAISAVKSETPHCQFVLRKLSVVSAHKRCLRSPESVNLNEAPLSGIY